MLRELDSNDEAFWEVARSPLCGVQRLPYESFIRAHFRYRYVQLVYLYPYMVF